METYQFPNASYSTSKLMAYWLVRKMQLENEWLTSMSVHPGRVATDMGNEGAKLAGMERAALTLEESMVGVTKAVCVSDFVGLWGCHVELIEF